MAKKDTQKKAMPKAMKTVLVIVADLIMIGVFLCTFAYFHHVRPHKSTEAPVVIVRPTEAPAAIVETTPGPSTGEDAQPTEVVPLTWKEKFADKFTDGEVIRTENSYISANTHVTITKHETTVQREYNKTMVNYPLVYYVADIYITDVEQFGAVFAKGEYLPGSSASTLNQVVGNNGVIGINGDNYGSRQIGLVIRNGVLYRQDLYPGDVMVLYYDGTMEPIYYSDVDVNSIVAKGPYQAWSFGPIFVKDGQQVISPQREDYIDQDNPRTSIGYFEPGHYCMVVVEGRSDTSIGANSTEISQIFLDLGCESAYNLDGGGTSAMVFNGEYVNERAGGGRNSNDTIVIFDPDFAKDGE
ncbi:MAG: phosphodiester glycosidase family protein [Clostridia bacterium]|nr:phosphodiester glycosidase family protein [Clostridia bacterium]